MGVVLVKNKTKLANKVEVDGAEAKCPASVML
jgi:hypothetical protein